MNKSIKTVCKNKVKIIIVFMLLTLFSCPYDESEVIVSYSVASSAAGSYANITYTIDDEKVSLPNQVLPWEYQFKSITTSEYSMYLELTGQKSVSDASTMTIKISYDDREKVSESFSDDTQHVINAIR